MNLDEKTYSTMAVRELDNLLEQIDEFDPDEVEGFLQMGVLRVTFFEKELCVINSHSAAREIWMAWDGHAWHFAWDGERKDWRCTRTDAELYETVSTMISKRLDRDVVLKRLG